MSNSILDIEHVFKHYEPGDKLMIEFEFKNKTIDRIWLRSTTGQEDVFLKLESDIKCIGPKYHLRPGKKYMIDGRFKVEIVKVWDKLVAIDENGTSIFFDSESNIEPIVDLDEGDEIELF